MQTHIMPIFIAFIVCFMLASFLTLPWAIYQYRKYGYISFWRTFLIISFLFYSLSAFFLVILPLPIVRNNCQFADPIMSYMQLRPFQFIQDIAHDTGVVWSRPSSYKSLVGALSVYQVVFNVLLLFPAGVFLRYLFKTKDKWFYVIFIGFGVSLFFEITQLTGVFGIFTCPYRLFDVDDLMANTLGTFLGFLFAPLFLAFIPSRDKLNEEDETHMNEGQSTIGAQLFGLVLDVILVRFITGVVMNVMKWTGTFTEFALFTVVLFVGIVIVPMIWKGYTLGSRIVRMKLQPDTTKWFTSLSRRYLAIYLPYFFSGLAGVANQFASQAELLLLLFSIGLVFLSVLLWMTVIGHILIRWIKKDKPLYFNEYSNIISLRRHTKN
ncbi:VanZ family protein [Sporosarcina sp. resist]|uniref:VanZ family protein n=1 Tax=Sporosarcina sp. resist TaxID=2762563 RepID=UPI00164D0851|nr:VanZ family protein [Sporosarcina sp. resist]QNK87903.1 VanZ family protein [Sporosarcina sp. resist]